MDPSVSLAFNLHANRGAYALLLGSGLSRRAGVLTGWEIVQHLISRYARLAGEDAGNEPKKWYAGKFGKDPRYSDLLNELGHTPADRSVILRSYFEPTAEERESGVKVPTEAHRAIARLVGKGYIRVIVTTNFDALIETAIRDADVSPTVISTDDQARAALPIQHLACVVVKPNGDYLDPRIKNTPEELADYEPSIRQLLARIWDEYGLVVAGWSAEWDTGLCSLLENAKTRRFSVFWCHRSELAGTALRVADCLRAERVPIEDVETFFPDLAEKILSVEESEAGQPLDTKLAVATLKRNIDLQHDIRVHDQASTEVENLWKNLTPERFPVDGPFTTEDYVARIEHCERITERLLHLLCAGVTFGRPANDPVWFKTIQRVGSRPEAYSGDAQMLALRGYPAVLIHYATGLAALAAQRPELMARLLLQPVRDEEYDDTIEMMRRRPLGDAEVFERLLPGSERTETPLSVRVFKVIREPLRPYIQDDKEYDHTFDRFEYLRTIVGRAVCGWGPVGRFLWKGWRGGWRVQSEIDDAKISRYWKEMSPAFPGVPLEKFLEAWRRTMAEGH